MSTDTTPRSQRVMWERVDELLALADEPPLELRGIAAWRALERGDTESAVRFHENRHTIAYGNVTVRPLLERVRDTIGQPIMLLKGAEIAALYPATALRPFGDLDLLVPGAVTAETALLAAGFEQSGSALREPAPWHHHRLPLRFPGLPLGIELHHDPGWLSWMTPPSNRELFDRAIPSATGVDGIVTLPPVEATLHHAMHSWRHGPYHSLLHMIDIELMRQQANAADLVSTASRWGLERVWGHTVTMLDWCFHDRNTPLSPLERAWSRHLRAMRARSYRESQIAPRSTALGAPADQMLSATWTTARRNLTPRAGESALDMVVRIGRKLIG